MNVYFLKEIGLEGVFPVLHVVIYSSIKSSVWKRNHLSLALNQTLVGCPLLLNTSLPFGYKYGVKDGLGRKMILALCSIKCSKASAEK